jgi:uncharacterized phage protein gp47/JayE
MPAPYGAVSTGFNRKTVAEILSDIEAAQRAEISPNLDLSSATPWGQNNGIFANELGIAWEQLEVCYHAFDPDAAEDFLLTSLGKLTGTERRGASYSLVTLTCTLESGTTLESDVHFAAVDGNSDSLWTPDEDFTAPSTGDHEVVFRAQNTGPVAASQDTITVIHTSLVGWSAVTNPEAASVGRDVDDDATLRQRREAQLTATGSATTDAIRADVLEVDGVIDCTVFENDSDDTVDGMPPHSIEVLVYDGDPSAAGDEDIAQAIWNTRAAGIQTVGGESAAATDALGESRTVYFSRPDVVDIYIDITVETGAGFVGAPELKNYLAEQAQALHGVGDDVRIRRVDSLVFDLAGVVDVTVFEMGITASPSGTTNVTIGAREIAAFDASRITVTEV